MPVSEEKLTLKQADKPKENFLTKTLHAVRGDSTQQLVEAFTSEMTLVAEGLCDDQLKLRDEVKDIRCEQEHLSQLIDSQMSAQDAGLRETQQALDKRLDELGKRVKALETQQEKQLSKKPKGSKESIIRQVTYLAAVIGGSWIIVTVLNLFK